MATIAKTKDLLDLEKILTEKINGCYNVVLFDLDGTLHDFHYSANIAKKVAFKLIELESELSINKIASEYQKLIKIAEQAAFTEKKSSIEYRFERFGKLLKNLSLKDDNLLDNVVELYSSTIVKNYKFDDRLHSFLKKISNTYVLFITTEGPRDAQLKALEGIGVVDYFKDVYTSADFGQKKEDGKFFIEVVEHLNLEKQDCLVIGDNLLRDIGGANIAGLDNIHFHPYV